MLAQMPPYSKILRLLNMATPFALFISLRVSGVGAQPASGAIRRSASAFPHS
jgi:hypothetical protein